MATGVTLPPGFVLDEAPASGGGLPPGFVLDAEPRMSPKGANQPVEALGTVETVRRAVTGDGRMEFPDAEEFMSALGRGGVLPQDLERMRDLSLSGAARSAVTPDENAQLDILRKNVPGLEDRRDQQGNLMLRAPGAGVAEWTYLNKPGLSGRDAEEVATQTLAALPFGGMFGRGASVAGRVASGAVAGGAASVTQDALATAAGSEQGVDPGRAALSSVFSGALGPLLGRPTAVQAPSSRSAALDAAERIDVAVPRAMASDSSATHMVAGATRGLPFGSPLAGAADDVVEGLGTAANRVAAEFGGGGPGTAFSAGTAARDEMAHWLSGRGGGTSRDVSERLYDGVRRQVSQTVTVPLAETRVALNTLRNEMAASGGRANQVAIGRVEDAANRQGGLTFDGISQLRTEIGALIDGSITPEPGTSIPALRRIYEALTVDRNRIVMHAGGPRALQALNRADSVHRIVSNRRETIARIIGERGDVAPERVFDRIAAMAQTSARGDAERLLQLRKVVGSGAWDEVAGGVVARLGRGPDDQFSPARFLTAYGKLTDNGKNVLFGSTGRGDLRQALDDIATVSRRFEESMSRYANPSGTGRAVTSVAGIAGAVTAPMQTLAAAIGGYGLAYALSRPVTARAAARWSNAYMVAATRPSQSATVLLHQASQQLADAMDGKEGGR
jgi:hypothetical protein